MIEDLQPKIPRKRGRPRYRSDDRDRLVDEIINLRNRGKSLRKIGESLGISKSLVGLLLKTNKDPSNNSQDPPCEYLDTKE